LPKMRELFGNIVYLHPNMVLAAKKAVIRHLWAYTILSVRSGRMPRYEKFLYRVEERGRSLKKTKNAEGI